MTSENRFDLPNLKTSIMDVRQYLRKNSGKTFFYRLTYKHQKLKRKTPKNHEQLSLADKNLVQFSFMLDNIKYMSLLITYT